MATTGDILSVHIDGQPSAYARIEGFEPDRKRGWWQVHLLFLAFPPQRAVWILKEEYFNGTPFTMQGTPMQLIPLPAPAIDKQPPTEPESEPHSEQPSAAPVISLAERRRKQPSQE